METTTLGKTGLKISKLGIGLSETGFNLSAEDEAQAVEVINSALDSGINFLDTAACYGLSEEQIGKAVSHRRDEFTLATKAGHFLPRNEGEDWTAEVISTSIDRSLQRMKTDHVDLLQLHSCNVEVLEKGEVIEALQKARDAGKTRFIGYSGDNENAEWAVNSGVFDTLQTSFNLLDQNARIRLFPKAEEQGMGIIVKRPIGNAVWGAKEDPNPYKHHATSYTGEYFRRAGAMQAEGPLPQEPEDRILTAMGFLFAHPEVDVAIVGTQRPHHLKSNVELMSKLPIPEQTVYALHERYDRLSAGWEQRG